MSTDSGRGHGADGGHLALVHEFGEPPKEAKRAVAAEHVKLQIFELCEVSALLRAKLEPSLNDFGFFDEETSHVQTGVSPAVLAALGCIAGHTASHRCSQLDVSDANLGIADSQFRLLK